MGEIQTSIGLCRFGEETFPIKIETEIILRSSEDEIKDPLWKDFPNVRIKENLEMMKALVKIKR